MVDIFTKALGIEKLHRLRGWLSGLELDLSLRGSIEICEVHFAVWTVL